MKILILVTIITWSFDGGYQNTPESYDIVGLSEIAAIYVYNDRINRISVEPDRKKHILYEVDLEKKIIKEINIPKISFE